MPIYAYRCDACGHAKDVLQKVSDPVLTVCPSCGAESFRKQVTAAGFQLKGSGWYVTDFRGGDSKKGGKAAEAGDGAKTEAAKPDAAKPESGKSDSGGTAATPASAPSTPPTGGSSTT